MMWLAQGATKLPCFARQGTRARRVYGYCLLHPPSTVLILATRKLLVHPVHAAGLWAQQSL